MTTESDNRLAQTLLWRVFSSFMPAHAQAINEYRGGEMSTEVVVDGNLWREIVERGSMVELLTFVIRVQGPSSRPVLTFYFIFFLILFF